jgi:hypothetical protein
VTIVAALRLEALAVGGTRIGMRARRPLPAGRLVLAGVAGAVVAGIEPGDIVVADRVLLSPTLPPGPPGPADPVDPADPTDPADPADPPAAMGLADAADPADPADPGDPPAALGEAGVGGPADPGDPPAALGRADAGVRGAAGVGGDAGLGGEAGVGGEVVLPGAADIARALRIAGLRVHVGPVGGADRVVTGTARGVWAQRGAIAVDMESGVLARTGRLAAVVRAIVDTPVHPVVSPGTLPRGARALRALRRAAPVLSAWAAGRDDPDVRERQAAHVVDITITLPGEVENS